MNPPNPLIFYKFLLFFLYIFFFHNIFLPAKFHKDAKYIILYRKMELLQPFGSFIKNKKIAAQKIRDQNNLFPVPSQTF